MEPISKLDSKQEITYVKPEDLPLSCPMKGKELWNAHPKVYLPIEKTGESSCPYCGANYKLVE